MGFDAWALQDGKQVSMLDESTPVRQAFKAAAERVRQETGSCDGELPNGALTISTTSEMLERATGLYWYSEVELTPDEVQRVAEKADWDFAVEDQDRPAYRSAQEFLRICSEFSLEVQS